MGYRGNPVPGKLQFFFCARSHPLRLSRLSTSLIQCVLSRVSTSLSSSVFSLVSLPLSSSMFSLVSLPLSHPVCSLSSLYLSPPVCSLSSLYLSLIQCVLSRLSTSLLQYVLSRLSHPIQRRVHGGHRCPPPPLASLIIYSFLSNFVIFTTLVHLREALSYYVGLPLKLSFRSLKVYTAVLYAVSSNANNHELFPCAPLPL